MVNVSSERRATFRSSRWALSLTWPNDIPSSRIKLKKKKFDLAYFLLTREYYELLAKWFQIITQAWIVREVYFWSIRFFSTLFAHRHRLTAIDSRVRPIPTNLKDARYLSTILNFKYNILIIDGEERLSVGYFSEFVRFEFRNKRLFERFENLMFE